MAIICSSGSIYPYGMARSCVGGGMGIGYERTDVESAAATLAHTPPFAWPQTQERAMPAITIIRPRYTSAIDSDTIDPNTINPQLSIEPPI